MCDLFRIQTLKFIIIIIRMIWRWILAFLTDHWNLVKKVSIIFQFQGWLLRRGQRYADHKFVLPLNLIINGCKNFDILFLRHSLSLTFMVERRRMCIEGGLGVHLLYILIKSSIDVFKMIKHRIFADFILITNLTVLALFTQKLLQLVI